MLQQTGGAWCFSGLFSWDLCPICRVIRNEGYWLTFVGEKCNFDLSISILNVDVVCESPLQKGIPHVTDMVSQCYVSCGMGCILNSVVK